MKTTRERTEYQRSWREANRDKIREYQRAYREANRARLDEQKREWYIANAERLREKARKNAEGRSYSGLPKRAVSPERRSVQVAIATALRQGRLKRPNRCEECGEEGRPSRDGRAGIHGHHADYSQPLDVQWLCRACHGLAHRRVAP